MLTAAWYLATWIGLPRLTAVAFTTGTGGIAISLVVAQPIARRLR